MAARGLQPRVTSSLPFGELTTHLESGGLSEHASLSCGIIDTWGANPCPV